MGEGPDGGEDPGEGRPQGYIAVIKPRVLLLLVFAGVAAMVASGGRDLDLGLLGLLLAGGLMATASANILNNVIDRDRDSLMTRTMMRPIPAGLVGPVAAAAVAVVLGVAGLAVLWLTVNPLTAALTLAGMLYYILVYSVVLKPRTTENITIGGVAGAFPPVVGWAAVTGAVEAFPVLLGLLVVLWTPPHFWSLALFYAEDYERAGVPMLPVVRGEAETHRRIVAYTVALVVASLALVGTGEVGLVYLVSATVLAVPILLFTVRLAREGTVAAARALFKFSSVYLALLLLAVILDAVHHFAVL